MTDRINVNLRINGKDYTLQCRHPEREQMLRAAEKLNGEIRALQHKYPSMDIEKIMALAGLSLANYLIQNEETFIKEIRLVNRVSEGLTTQLDQVLNDIENKESGGEEPSNGSDEEKEQGIGDSYEFNPL